MKQMTRLIVNCFLIIIWLIPFAAQAQSVQDTLWQKALIIAEANQDFVPGFMIMRMEELDKNGKVKSITETWTRLTLGENGELEYDTIKILKDGEDVTNEPKKSGKSESVSVKVNPFDPDVQDDVSVNRTDRQEVINDKQCVIYEFVQKTEDEKEDEKVLSGTAWLEKETGVPVQIQFKTDPLPKHTKRMLTTMCYEFIPEESWHLKEMIMEATAGFLWIKKHFRVTVNFSEHWKKPED